MQMLKIASLFDKDFSVFIFHKQNSHSVYALLIYINFIFFTLKEVKTWEAVFNKYLDLKVSLSIFINAVFRSTDI